MSEFFESSFAEATEKRRENATMTKHGLGSRIRDRLDKLHGIQESADAYRGSVAEHHPSAHLHEQSEVAHETAQEA